MGACHWCARCGWRDEDQMSDPRTCYCGNQVNTQEPTELFEVYLDRCRRREAMMYRTLRPSFFRALRRLVFGA